MHINRIKSSSSVSKYVGWMKNRMISRNFIVGLSEVKLWGTFNLKTVCTVLLRDSKFLNAVIE